MNGLDLFSGIGGITLALRDYVRPVAYCEIDRYCQAVLLSRMHDGSLPVAPIWDDVTTLNAGILAPLGQIDIIYGGFPCQPYSSAARGRNKPDTMLGEFVRLVSECKPTFVFAENVNRPAIRGLYDSITELGYRATAKQTYAANVGAPFIGRRCWLLGTTDNKSKPDLRFNDEMAVNAQDEKTLWEADPRNIRVAHGVSFRVDRLRALGNAVVPIQAREAFERLMERA